ncbi:hypothetical protein [Streptomyces sp. NPDC020983]|uniref:hypothetical protein n=1 Tax=Streptomyces sp. NPDC020983 TaxID=3365106 RepID=UPI00379C805B
MDGGGHSDPGHSGHFGHHHGHHHGAHHPYPGRDGGPEGGHGAGTGRSGGAGAVLIVVVGLVALFLFTWIL